MLVESFESAECFWKVLNSMSMYKYFDSSNDYAATSLMFKLSSLFGFLLRKRVGQQSRFQSLRCGGEGSGNEIDGAKTSKFEPIAQFGDFRSIENTTQRLYGASSIQTPPKCVVFSILRKSPNGNSNKLESLSIKLVAA